MEQDRAAGVGAPVTCSEQSLLAAPDVAWVLEGSNEPFSDRDLERLGGLVGEAQVVAFGEVWHGMAEPLTARNQLFRHLVQSKGFTAIAVESGVAEAAFVAEYIRDGVGNLDEVMSRGFTWQFGDLPQNRSLVQWMRRQNEASGPTQKLAFYGFDLPGSLANPSCARWYDVPLQQLLDFLSAASPRLAEVFAPRLAPLICGAGRGGALDGARQAQLVLARDVDGTTAALCDLLQALKANERLLVEGSSKHQYEWALQAAVGAMQLDASVRAMPREFIRTEPADLRSQLDEKSVPITRQSFEGLLAAQNLRDRAQADNVAWLLQQEAPTGKVLLFAANAHLSATPCKLSYGGHDGAFEVAGTYLRRWLGDQLVIIGATGGAGATMLEGTVLPLPEPARESVDGLAGGSEASSFAADLRRLPDKLRGAWD